ALAPRGGARRRDCRVAWRRRAPYLFRLSVSWAPDGKFFYVGVKRGSLTTRGKTVALPIRPGESFPDLPPEGIRGLDDQPHCQEPAPSTRMISRPVRILRFTRI